MSGRQTRSTLLLCGSHRSSGWGQWGRQRSASPRASSDSPCPRGGVGLEMSQNPDGDSWREENGVGELPRDVVVAMSDLGYGDVTHPRSILAVASILGGGRRQIPMGG